MVSVRPEMKYLMSTFLPSFPQICAQPKPCLANCEVDFEACHVTVVSLAQDNFGRIYRVCPINGSRHELTASENLDVPYAGPIGPAVLQIPATEFKRLGQRYLLLGGVAEWNRTTQFSLQLRTETVRVALEVLWYLPVAEGPVSVPMIAWAKDGLLHIPLDQPIIQEMIPEINPWRRPRTTPSSVPQVWSSSSGKWVLPHYPGEIQLSLPLTEVPAVRMGMERRLQPSPQDATAGIQLDPLSSMKSQMYDLPYIWPQQLTVPRRRFTGMWQLPPPGFEGGCIECRGGNWNAMGRGAHFEENGSENHLALALALPAPLSKMGFGRIYDYCPISHESGHLRAEASTAYPIPQDELDGAWQHVPHNEVKLWQNKHLLLGAVPQWNRTREFDKMLRYGTRVVVEVIWYYARERVIIQPHPADKVARGRMQLTPMCSMKAQMYDLGYIWPEHFTYPRARYDMVWKVDVSEHESSGNAIKPYKEYEEEVVYMEGRENAEVLGISRVVWSILVDSDSDLTFVKRRLLELSQRSTVPPIHAITEQLDPYAETLHDTPNIRWAELGTSSVQAVHSPIHSEAITEWLNEGAEGYDSTGGSNMQVPEPGTSSVRRSREPVSKGKAKAKDSSTHRKTGRRADKTFEGTKTTTKGSKKKDSAKKAASAVTSPVKWIDMGTYNMTIPEVVATYLITLASHEATNNHEILFGT
ncbi:hypothetical protein FOMPIDRAFT_1020909, partial [Fomitopsis schrenkii]